MFKSILKYLSFGLIILLISLKLASLKPSPQPKNQPSPSPTASASDYTGWKEYNNQKYHYIIKYPHDWYFHQTGFNPPPPTVIHLANVSEEKTSSPHVSVEVFVDQKQGRTLDNYQEIQNLISQGFVARELKVSGAKALLIDNLGNTGDQANLYIDHGDYIYRLGWNGTHPDVKSQFKDTCLKIIASIKFTD